MLHIFDDEQLIEHIRDYDVVLVGMGINNAFSNGFPSFIKVHYPEVRRRENELSPYGDRRKYGTCLPIKFDGIEFVMCYIHDGGYRKSEDGTFLNYESLEKCLQHVSKKYTGKKIASTLMGCCPYDGNGDAKKVKNMFEEAFNGAEIDIYTKDQGNFDEIVRKKLLNEYKKYKSGEISLDEYIKNKSKLVWERKNGIYSEMPKNFTAKRAFSWENVVKSKKN